MIEVKGEKYQVVAMGPLFGTVWARRVGTEEHVVIKLAARGKPHEITAWSQPPPLFEVPKRALDQAREIMHREWRCVVREDMYLSSVQGRATDRDVVRPEAAEVERARAVIELSLKSMAVAEAYRMGHTATNAIGEAKLLELLHQTVTKEDQTCASETGSSADTE